MKILYITSDLDGGGIERLLYDYGKRLLIDNSVQIDFAITSDKEGILEKPILSLGCKIYRIAKINDSIKQRNADLKKIIRKNYYDIVHDNSAYKAFFSLKTAKKCGVKVRIAHSHLASPPESFFGKCIRMFFTFLTKRYATNLFACGQLAGEWTWGKSCFRNGKVFVMKNAIDSARFTFSPAIREKIRRELHLKDTDIVIGNIARFTFQKNHEFLINVFYELSKINENYVLVLVGTGELESTIKGQVEALGLTEKVIFTGVRSDTFELYNAFDSFILTSRFEGLPVTFVEAQANGLTTFGADTITREIKLNPNVHYLSLNASYAEWAKAIDTTSKVRISISSEQFTYDIDKVTKQIHNKYISLITES